MHKWIVDTVNSVLRTVIAAAVISVLIGLWAYLDNLPGSVIAVIVLFAIGGVLLVFTQLRKLHPFKGGETVAGRDAGKQSGYSGRQQLYRLYFP